MVSYPSWHGGSPRLTCACGYVCLCFGICPDPIKGHVAPGSKSARHFLPSISTSKYKRLSHFSLESTGSSTSFFPFSSSRLSPDSVLFASFPSSFFTFPVATPQPLTFPPFFPFPPLRSKTLVSYPLPITQ